MKTISIVLPVFRNEGSIRKTWAALKHLFISTHAGLGYEIIMVDDGSDDQSLAEIISIIGEDSNAKALSFSRNFGQVPAIIAGLKGCTGDAAIVMSADLQDPVELISQMLHAWEDHSQIVICQRSDREDSAMARFTSRMFYNFMKLSNPRMPAGGFDYVLMDRTAIDVFNSIDERNRFFQGDILWMGFNTRFIPYKRLKRTIGKSQWTFGKKLKYFIDGSLNMSYLPLRFMSLLGLSVSIIGFLYAAVVFYARLINKVPFDGFAPIVILLLIIGGIIMIMLGVIGEYLWRIYDETRKRAVYVVRDRLGDWKEGGK